MNVQIVNVQRLKKFSAITIPQVKGTVLRINTCVKCRKLIVVSFTRVRVNVTAGGAALKKMINKTNAFDF